MKKTVSIVLSIAMVLSLMTGLFTLNLSADEVPYADRQAQILWESAYKATEMKIFFSKDALFTIPDETNDLNLKEAYPEWFASGTLTFNEGVLTLNNVVVAEGKSSPVINANGGLNINFTGADLNAAIRIADSADFGYANPPANSHLIITSSDGKKLYSTGTGLRTNCGALVTYGPMSLDIATTNWDAVMVSNNAGTDYPMILGNTGESILTANGAGPAVHSRAGDIIFCGDGSFTVKNTNATHAGHAIRKESQGKAKNSSIKILDSVNMNIETVGGDALQNDAAVDSGKDSIVISTTGTVKITTSALQAETWGKGNVIYALYGTIRVSSKVLIKSTLGTGYKGACGTVFYAENKGTDYNAGVYFEGNADVAVSVVNNVESARTTGIWVNAGVVKVSDDARLTIRYDHQKACKDNFSAIVFRIGAMYISDNAKVYLHGLDASKSLSKYSVITFQKGSTSGSETDAAAQAVYEADCISRAHFGDNAGLHVSGGQLEVNAPSNFVSYAFTEDMRGGTHFTGGVVSVKDASVDQESRYLFPAGLDQVITNRYNELANQEYAGPVTLFDGTKITKGHAWYNDKDRRSGNVAEYLYVAKDATFTEYDGIAENADFFGTLSTAHNDIQSYFVDNPRYRVSLSSLVTAPTHGDKVDVYVNVTHEASTEYAASELTVNYDAAKLAFDQASSQLNGAEVTDADGVLKIVNYGQDKLLGNGIYTLSFTTLVSGESSVTLASAAFADKVSAEESDLLVGVIDPDTATVTFSVQKKVFQVTLPAGFEGPETVTDGESYTFKLVDNNYNYSNFSATAGETPLVVTDNGDGTYTVNNVTGNLTVTVDSVPKSYPVTFTPSDAIASGDATATYGTNYVFHLKDNILPGETDGTNYSVESITVGGVAFNDYTVEDRKVTVPGAAITGDIAVTVKVERVDANKFAVTVDGSGAGDVKTEGVTFVAEKGQPYSITLIPQLGYDYTVTATVAGNSAQVSVEGNVYTVQNVGGPVVFTVTRTVNTDNVTYSEFITLDSAESDMYLVLNKTTVGEGKVPTLNGVAMFWSEKYDAYCGLVIIPAPASENDVKSLISIADGNALTVDYGMDVNKTGKVDAADAQLVYNMYNAYYTEFTSTVTQEKFLRADVNGDKVIDVTDATAIVTEILK